MQKTMLIQPLGEVFGFPPDDQSVEAQRYRKQRLCPFNNIVPNCTKDKAQDPLGVCSIAEGDHLAITCPVRFRQNWIIADDAAEFFFPPDTKWTSLSEVRLTDKNGKSAGNIDLVLAAYSRDGKILDFGSCEVQAVYISGNVRDPFEAYMSAKDKKGFSWDGKKSPHSDYLSSSRKRLAPQLLFKGGILHAWGKKQAVALTTDFYKTLPKLEPVPKEESDIAWMLYDIRKDSNLPNLQLTKNEIIYTRFQTSMQRITSPEVGPVSAFLEHLQAKLDEKLEPSAPDAKPLSPRELA